MTKSLHCLCGKPPEHGECPVCGEYEQENIPCKSCGRAINSETTIDLGHCASCVMTAIEANRAPEDWKTFIKELQENA